MSEVWCERQARSLALEKAYVHQVYQKISDVGEAASELGRPWPRVVQFLHDLEPGSLVCDVGCGSGKYLDANPNIFTIGVDRCKRLAEVVREKDSEVMMSDNLSLPYRDDSFDAVLSIAVIHHFATTERRVAALRELARILRIGGRVIITVWAMEQRHRKFESQDVLVPWHRPQNLSTPSLDASTTATNTSEEDGSTPYNACAMLASDTESANSHRCSCSQLKRRSKTRHKEVFDPNQHLNSSQSSSSLSSPNETCYSFVRRALQKLARGKRGTSGRHKPWFLHTWTTCTQDTSRRRYDPDGCENIHLEDLQDIPIELRRLEEEDVDLPENNFTNSSKNISENDLGPKSKSLTDILMADEGALVRSRSSVPSLGGKSDEGSNSYNSHYSGGYLRTLPLSSSRVITTQPKPRLIKQKQSLCDEDCENEKDDQLTDMHMLINSLPQFKTTSKEKRRNEGVLKQNSMHEEIMSLERLQENERVRKNLLKQFSLNEEYDFRRQRPLDSLRETILATSAAKRIQLLKIGLTNKIKTTTTGIEKVSGAERLKNGFVKMFQGWKSDTPPASPRRGTPSSADTSATNGIYTNPVEICGGERRHSKEDSSDSSKDSSLQSDTSVDSEDSFASVIFIPRPEQVSPPVTTSPTASTTKMPSPQATVGPSSPKFKFQSPPSPMVGKQPPLPSSRYPTTPQPSTPRSTKQSYVPISPKFKYQMPPLSPNCLKSFRGENDFDADTDKPFEPIQKVSPSDVTNTNAVTVDLIQSDKNVSSSGKQGTKNFPLVRRAASMVVEHGTSEPLVRPLPKLLSLELFNPETDDVDSDSSAASSPDSVSSVISILTEELSTSSHEAQYCKRSPSATNSTPGSDLNLSDQSIASLPNSKSPELISMARSPVMGIGSGATCDLLDVAAVASARKCARSPENILSSTDSSPRSLEVPKDECAKQKPIVPERSSSRSPEILRRKAQIQNRKRDERFIAASVEMEDVQRSTLFSAVADVASSLEGAVDAVIQSSSPRGRRRLLTSEPVVARRLVSPESDEYSKENMPLLSACEENSGSESDELRHHQRNSDVIGSSWTLGREKWQKKDRSCRKGQSWSLGRLDKDKGRSGKPSEPLPSIRQRRNIRSHSLSLYNPDNLPIESTQHEEAESADISMSLPSGLDDPFATRLSAELNDLTRLTTELKERNTYLASLSDEDLNKELNHPQNNPFLSSEPMSVSSNPFASQLTSNPFLDDNVDLYRDAPSGCSSQTDDFVPLEIESPPHKRLNVSDGAEDFNIDTEKVYRKPSIIMTNSSPGPTDTMDFSNFRKNSLPESRGHSLESTETDSSDVSRRVMNLPRDTSRITLASSLGHSQESNDTSGSHPSDSSSHVTTAGSNDASDGSSRTRELPRDMSRVTIASSSLGHSMEGSESETPEYHSRRDVCRITPSTASMGHSLESSDLGEVSERTCSDFLRKETFSAATGQTGGSSTSLAMSSDCSKDTRYADRRKMRCDGRSSSEETPKKILLVRQKASVHEPVDLLTKTQSVDNSLTGSTSQESLPSDGGGGGSITFHRFYHVFREGELDQLIERYVENLHIISSYYDHANWCVIAEKVQVWTI